MANLTAKQSISAARKRLKDRAKHCTGCFGLRNNLIVKAHIEKVWQVSEIRVFDTYVELPCKVCSVRRHLPLSHVSLNLYKTELQRYEKVVLLKDGKYNVLMGFGSELVDLKDYV